MTRLLLASKSMARRAMLEQAGIAFDIVASPADEDSAKAELVEAGASASDVAERLAALKACAVAGEGDALVLGADQVLEPASGPILSKPESRQSAAAQLRSLAGTTHRLHSAAALAVGGETVWSSVETVELAMRDFSDAFLSDYLEREWEAVRWNVGAYRIEGMGVQLFDSIRGSHFAILGLPLLSLLAELRRRGMLTS